MLLVTVGTAVAICAVSVVGTEVGVNVGLGVGVTASPPQLTSNVIVVKNRSNGAALKVMCNKPINSRGSFRSYFTSPDYTKPVKRNLPCDSGKPQYCL